MPTSMSFREDYDVIKLAHPGHKLDEYVQKLRDRHDVTVSIIGLDGERHTVSYLSVEHEARNAREAAPPPRKNPHPAMFRPQPRRVRPPMGRLTLPCKPGMGTRTARGSLPAI